MTYRGVLESSFFAGEFSEMLSGLTGFSFTQLRMTSCMSCLVALVFKEPAIV